MEALESWTTMLTSLPDDHLNLSTCSDVTAACGRRMTTSAGQCRRSCCCSCSGGRRLSSVYNAVVRMSVIVVVLLQLVGTSSAVAVSASSRDRGPAVGRPAAVPVHGNPPEHQNDGDEGRHHHQHQSRDAGRQELDADVVVPCSDAQLKDDQRQQIERCLDQGRDFIVNYTKSFRKRRSFDKCSRYVDAVKCLRPYVTSVRTRCTRQRSDDVGSDDVTWSSRGRSTSSVVEQLRDWIPVVDQLDRLCETLTASSNRSREIQRQRCIDDELLGVLSLRCDEIHKFNVDQRTRHECHFLRERVHCKEALVTSACGREAGNFAFSVTKIVTGRLASRHHCQISRDPHYKGFRYDADCPTTFLKQVEACSTRHLTERNVITFTKENDLVAVDGSVRHACRSYKRYVHCVEPVVSRCSRGVELLLDYESNLRLYLLKMNYICSDAILEAYMDNLDCYQTTVKDAKFGQCDSYWADLTPWLHNITAYQFYCQPNHPNTVNLLREVNKLHMCHSAILSAVCGDVASTIMADFIQLALHDPIYLRLGHRPDCALHSGLTSPRPPSTSTSTPYVERHVLQQSGDETAVADSSDTAEATDNVDNDISAVSGDDSFFHGSDIAAASSPSIFPAVDSRPPPPPLQPEVRLHRPVSSVDGDSVSSSVSTFIISRTSSTHRVRVAFAILAASIAMIVSRPFHVHGITS